MCQKSTSKAKGKILRAPGLKLAKWATQQSISVCEPPATGMRTSDHTQEQITEPLVTSELKRCDPCVQKCFLLVSLAYDAVWLGLLQSLLHKALTNHVSPPCSRLRIVLVWELFTHRFADLKFGVLSNPCSWHGQSTCEHPNVADSHPVQWYTHGSVSAAVSELHPWS